MLVDKVKKSFKVDEDETILKIANDVANRKDLAVEDRVSGLLTHYLQGILIHLLLLIILRHVFGKLVALSLGLHSDKS
jgi:hypothetical protein